MHGAKHILAISGSLREQSSNTAVLRAAVRLAPPGIEIAMYTQLGALPYFNPDHDREPLPTAVAELRRQVGAAAGLLICSPEYARGVAGVLKNALDWLVSSFEFPDKPVAVINASQRAQHADAALRLTLTTMSARLVEAASITLPLLGRAPDAPDIATDPLLADPLRQALETLAAAC